MDRARGNIGTIDVSTAIADVTHDPPPAAPQTRAGRRAVISRYLGRVLDGIEMSAVFVTGALLVGLVVVVLYEIIGREVSSGGAGAWTTEISTYLFIGITFVASSTTIARNTQPRVRAVVDLLPSSAQNPVDVGVSTATLVLYAALFYYGIKLVQFQWPQPGPSSGISLGVAALPIPIGAALMFISRIRRTHFLTSRANALVVPVVVIGLWWLLEKVPGTFGGDFYLITLPMLIFFFVSSMPVAEALLLSSLIAYNLTDPAASDLQFIQQLFSGLNTFTYVAIPLFLLTGALVAGTMMSQRILAFVRSFLGWLPGSLGVVDVAASAVFADLSGSAVSDTVAIGTVMLPQMAEDGYPPAFSAALQASAGTLGVMFPPSISALLFASAANVSVAYMFAATLIPGILVTLSLAAFVIVVGHRRRWGTRNPLVWRRVATTGVRAVPSLGVIVIVLGGLFGGFFTTVEAGAVAATYSAALGARELSRNRFEQGRAVLVSASETVGRVSFIIAAALTFGWLIVQNNGPQEIVSHLGSLAGNPVVLLLVLMAILLVVHEFMDVSATILVLVPLLLPLLNEANINTVHFGVLMDLNSTIGLVLPPLGFCLYLVASIAHVRFESAAKAVIPFIGILLADMLLVLFVPAMTTAFPNLLGLHP